MPAAVMRSERRDRAAEQRRAGAGACARCSRCRRRSCLLAGFVYLAQAVPQVVYPAIALLPDRLESRPRRPRLLVLMTGAQPRRPALDRGQRSAGAQGRQAADQRALASSVVLACGPARLVYALDDFALASGMVTP